MTIDQEIQGIAREFNSFLGNQEEISKFSKSFEKFRDFVILLFQN